METFEPWGQDRVDLGMAIRHRAFLRHLTGQCVKDGDDCEHCEKEAADA